MRLLAGVVSLLLIGFVSADDFVKERSLAATCTGCHGTNGVGAGAIPSIAGLSVEDFIVLMNEFREDARDTTIMHQIAKGYTDLEIRSMANFFSRQKR